MIDRAEMLNPRDKLTRLAIPTDRDIQYNLRSKIDAIRSSVELPIRIGRPYGDLGDKHSRSLFSITAEKYSYLEGKNWRDGKIWRVKADHLQQLGFEVMREYGFDENNSVPYKGMQVWKNKKFGSGDTAVEYKFYPSKTINGLAFERRRECDRDTGKTISVNWEVIDNAPLFRISLRKKAKK